MYDNTPGVKSVFLDGLLKTAGGSSQPRILVVGPASSGFSNEIFSVVGTGAADKEFGASSALMRGVHEVIGQQADNVAAVRSGGTRGVFVLTDSDANTLTITPELRDDQVLTRYALIMDGTGTTNRILVYDTENESFVFDSSEILALDQGVVEVVDTGIDLFSVNSITSPETATDMGSLVVGDFTVENVATVSTLTQTAGTDGTTPSLVETYAALNESYHRLDFRDGDFIIPMDVYIDSNNITDSDTSSGTYGLYWKGVPQQDSAIDELGYAWQYLYQGSLYTYFVDSATYFTDEGSATAATVTVNTDLVLTAVGTGIGGNAVTIELDATGGAGPTITVTETDNGFDILVTDDGTNDNASIATAWAAASDTLSTGVTAQSLVGIAGGATLITTVAKTNLAGGTGGHALTPANLTGDTVPSAVSTKFAAGADAELREVNFGHQLASFCYLASTQWKAMLGFISFDEPSAFSRAAIASWVGSLPTFTDDGVDIYIDAPADNGSGILGHKLMAGLSATSAGYRSGEVDNGDSTDGLAYGGLILTNGASLPNGSDWPYGIDSSDEAEDENDAPIDIGKHLLVSASWPIHTNSFNGGSVYRGHIAASIAGKLAVMPENEEPIGNNGRLRKVNTAPRIHSTQLDELAEIRVTSLRRDDVLGLVISNIKTAAHPDSDYNRVSTIRSVNRMLEGIRTVAKPFIGKAFSSTQLASLQAAIDGLIQAERQNGIHEGAKARLAYTRTDKIMGRLTVKLQMVPPFSIEIITAELSLAADESELST